MHMQYIYCTFALILQLPYMCPDQELQYTITIQSDDLSTVIVIGPKDIVYTSNMIEEDITSELSLDSSYSLVVHLSTVAGNSTSDSVAFGKSEVYILSEGCSKLVTFYTPTTDTIITPTTLSTTPAENVTTGK